MVIQQFMPGRMDGQALEDFTMLRVKLIVSLIYLEALAHHFKVILTLRRKLSFLI